MSAAPPARDGARLASQLEEWVAESLVIGPSAFRPGPDEPLLSSGLVDSLGLTRLLQRLSDGLGVAIEPLDVTLENFDTLARLTAFLTHRLPPAASEPTRGSEGDRVP